MERIDQYSDPELEKNVLTVLLRDDEVAIRYFPQLLPKHFTDENVVRLFTLARRYTVRSGTLLTQEALRVELNVLYPQSPEVVQGVLSMYGQLVSTPQAAPAMYLVDRLMNFFRVRSMLGTIQRSIRLLDGGRMEDSLGAFEASAFELQSANPNVFITRGEVIEDFEKRKALIADMRLNPDKYRGVLTGIDELDRVTGGLWDGELGFVFGKTGIGKSFFLLQVAYRAYLNDLRVLVIPVEMPLIQWQRRFDARISNVAYQQFKWATISESEEAQWEQCILQSRDDHYSRGARVFITHMPIGSAISGIRAELERLMGRGTPVDLLVVDYAQLMGSLESARTEPEDLTNKFRELKSIATSYDIPVWTAAQLKRVSYGKAQLLSDDVGYAAGPTHISDMVLGLAKSDTDTLAQRLFLSVAKFRDGVYNRLIVCRPNFAVAMISDG